VVVVKQRKSHLYTEPTTSDPIAILEGAVRKIEEASRAG
jgi:hypothetical protein